MSKTWGELRTLNSERLTEEICKLQEGQRIHFRMTISSESEWVIIPKDQYDQILFDHAEINRLKTKLKTIMNVAEL